MQHATLSDSRSEVSRTSVHKVNRFSFQAPIPAAVERSFYGGGVEEDSVAFNSTSIYDPYEIQVALSYN